MDPQIENIWNKFDKKPAELKNKGIPFEKSGDIEVQKTLDEKFRSLLKHQSSMFLPVNDFMKPDDYKKYTEVLVPYNIDWETTNEYEKNNPNVLKEDLIESGNPNIGWKVHLNIEPKDAVVVSNYLKENGYVHKYLSGGETEDGKVFTVYIGSHDLTKKLSEQISTDLHNFLKRPGAKYDIELSEGVVGRFVSTEEFFNPYFGSCGFVLPNEWVSGDNRVWNMRSAYKSSGERKTEVIHEGEAQAYRYLKRLYGDYFSPGN